MIHAATVREREHGSEGNPVMAPGGGMAITRRAALSGIPALPLLARDAAAG